MADVVAFQPVLVGDGYRIDADAVLDEAKEHEFNRLAVLGELSDGTLYLAGTANAGETMILLELAKHHLLFGDD